MENGTYDLKEILIKRQEENKVEIKSRFNYDVIEVLILLVVGCFTYSYIFYGFLVVLADLPITEQTIPLGLIFISIIAVADYILLCIFGVILVLFDYLNLPKRSELDKVVYAEYYYRALEKATFSLSLVLGILDIIWVKYLLSFPENP